ncbi:MAG: hypothetical protein Q7V56_15905 [Gammaproteobacteria bacterium]|nr:hypothetical protein [Gammaproteobacteria bacterium]
MNIKNRKSVYNNILMACFERSKSDPKYLDEAMTLVTMHDSKLSNFTSSISFVPEVYMARGEFGKALESIVSAIESKNGLNQSEYARLFFSVCIRIGEHVNSDDLKLPVVTDGSYVQLKGEDQWYRVGGENSLDAIHIKSESHLYEEFRHKKLEDPIRFVSEFERTSSHDVVSSILTREGYIFQKIRNAFQKLSQKDLIPGVRLFSIKEIDGKIDSEHLTRTLKSITDPDNSVFDIYREQALPFAFLAKAEGGFNNALGRIIGESAGYINFSDGTVRDFGDQVARAKKLLTTKSDAYLDGTSAVFLSEFSIFCRVLSELPNLKVPRSVVRLLTGLAHKFSSADSSKGSLSVRQGKIVYSEHDKARNLTVHQSLLEAIKNCEEENGRIAQISDANKSKDMIESLLPSELVDASILARKHHFQLITDDSHYLRASELVLGYEKLDHISSLALIRAMYELGRINFLKYLEYFGFLSNYRLRFLSISPEDIKKALFGDGLISDFRPELLDHFNLPVTLSEEYGVSPDELVRVLSYVILDLIMDDTICIDVFGRVAIEIMARTPQKSCKLRTLNSIIERCDSGLARTLQNLTIQLNPAPFQEKLDRLKYSRSLYKV